MDNQAMFNALQKTLIDGLAQTENRVLNKVTVLETRMSNFETELVAIKNNMATKTDVTQVRTEMNQGFDELKQLHYGGITEVANEMLDDKQQIRHEIDFLKRRIQHLEKKISGI